MAWNVESLIAFCAVQGMGAAVMIPGNMALISINTPRAERGKVLGIWVSASAIITSLGPLLGSLLLTYVDAQGWRWIFAINLPFGIVALAILGRLYQPINLSIAVDWLALTGPGPSCSRRRWPLWLAVLEPDLKLVDCIQPVVVLFGCETEWRSRWPEANSLAANMPERAAGMQAT